MFHLRLCALLLTCMACPADAQHFEYLYSFWREGAGCYIQTMKYDRGAISIDVDAKQMILHKRDTSLTIDFDEVEYDTRRHLWRCLVQKQTRHEDGGGWNIVMQEKRPAW